DPGNEHDDGEVLNPLRGQPDRLPSPAAPEGAGEEGDEQHRPEPVHRDAIRREPALQDRQREEDLMHAEVLSWRTPDPSPGVSFRTPGLASGVRRMRSRHR